MKCTDLFHAICIYLAIYLSSCTPDYGVVFPDEIPYGTNLVYIDGKLSDFTNNSFYHKTLDSLELLRISLEQNVNSGEFYNQITCSTFFPVENTKYAIDNEIKKSPNNVAVFFSQTYLDDLDGWEYKYCGSKEDLFIIEKFDLENQILYCKGKLKFKRTKKHGAPGGAGIDKIIYIEFVFHDYFEIK